MTYANIILKKAVCQQNQKLVNYLSLFWLFSTKSYFFFITFGRIRLPAPSTTATTATMIITFVLAVSPVAATVAGMQKMADIMASLRTSTFGVIGGKQQKLCQPFLLLNTEKTKGALPH